MFTFKSLITFFNLRATINYSWGWYSRHKMAFVISNKDWQLAGLGRHGAQMWPKLVRSTRTTLFRQMVKRASQGRMLWCQKSVVRPFPQTATTKAVYKDLPRSKQHLYGASPTQFEACINSYMQWHLMFMDILHLQQPSVTLASKGCARCASETRLSNDNQNSTLLPQRKETFWRSQAMVPKVGWQLSDIPPDPNYQGCVQHKQELRTTAI